MNLIRGALGNLGSRLGLALALGCAAAPNTKTATPESPEACHRRRQLLVEFVRQLPERGVVAAPSIELPIARVGEVPGSGPVLGISADGLVLDGSPTLSAVPTEQRAALRRWVANWLSTNPAKRTLYVAAASEVDVRTLRGFFASIPEDVDLRLLVRNSALLGADQQRSHPDAWAFSQKLLAEQDPVRQAELSRAAHARFAVCPALQQSIEGALLEPASERWPSLRRALLDKLPGCSCAALDTESLASVVAAEWRAGSAGLATLPGAFLRDARCGASMPSRSLGKLVKQIEGFDEEFAGTLEQDSVRFGQVLQNQRLQHFFCNALPGETLASKQRERATLYWRLPGSKSCLAWRFEPLEPGAPMGTWRRVAGEDVPSLAFHYWQAAEEIRLFGPALSGSKPTDAGEWSCRENRRMLEVDAHSIRTDQGRWFLEETACRRAPVESGIVPGCVLNLAGQLESQPPDSTAPRSGR